MKRFFVVFLLLALLLPAVSCADNAAGTSSDLTGAETETPATEKLYLDNLPADLDFDGRTIRMVTNDKASFETLEDAADVVDTEVYKRNRKIEERLNLILEPLINEDWGTAASLLKSSVLAGSDEFDLYGGYCYWSIDLATSGYMLNLADMEYLDLEAVYWGKKFIDAMAYKNFIYWVTGDIVLNYTNGVYATYVNLAQWNNYIGDTDLYQLVRDGKWTLDRVKEYAEIAYTDLNGDGKTDAEDFIGYVYTTEDPIDGMAMAAGVTFTEFDDEGVPYITLIGSERAVAFNEKLTALCTSHASLLTASDGGYSSVKLFGSLHALFTIGRLAHAVTFLRDMKEDFSIIPPPKLDEDQETYLTTLHDGTTILGIPKTAAPEAISAVCAALEALAAESYKSLTPVYLDVALKNKYTRDEQSAEMIDLIRENIVSDFGFQYTATGFNNFFRAQTKKGAEVASIMARSENKWITSMENILEALEENAG
ncbi:MAG: hypothetical protein PHZ09_04420 [Eubacteriales bacterium]|nr:hypothetical protein [Eubacteriales bacterium]